MTIGLNRTRESELTELQPSRIFLHLPAATMSRSPSFDFQAPQYHDFADAENNQAFVEDGADEWFDARVGSPAAAAAAEAMSRRSDKLSGHVDLLLEAEPSLLPTDENDEAVGEGAESPEETAERLSKTFANLSMASSMADDGDGEAEGRRAFDQQPAKKNKVVVARGPNQLTVPKEFSFVSRQKDKMNKVKAQSIQKRPQKRKNWKDLTVPKPFNFTRSKSDAKLHPQSPYVPLALRLDKFQKETPERFRMRRKFPKMKELEVAKMVPFKAKPVNKRILQGGPVGIPEVPKPALTVPMTPHIHKPKPHVVPPPSPPKVIKANPVPSFDKPFVPAYVERVLQVENFKLPGDEISEKKRKQFEEELARKAAEEERMRLFRARPLPDPSVDALPVVEPRPLTEPEPFPLHDGAHHRSRAAFAAEPTERLVKPFVAQPCPAFEAFIPQRSTKPPTHPETPHLHTDSRAEERRAFEEAQKKKEAMLLEMREVSTKEKEKRELEEVRRLRQLQVHHAQPVRHFPGVHLKPSSKKLTEPQSPLFREKRDRLRRAIAAGRTALAEDEGVDENENPDVPRERTACNGVEEEEVPSLMEEGMIGAGDEEDVFGVHDNLEDLLGRFNGLGRDGLVG
ncbi:Protein tpx2 [Irineochytrium annulatum]|nr:Protein tpx2 [Irineochytrium annulatum]